MNKEAKILLGIGLATIAIVIGGAFLFSKAPSDGPQTITDTEQALLIKGDSHQTSKDSGKISVVEFADIQCPACGASYPIVKQMKQEFGDQVNFVYRHFPLDSHKHAFMASLVTEAAAEQGKFWEMLDKLFATQQDWSDSTNPFDQFVAYAKEIGLDGDKLKADVEAKKYDDKVKADFRDGVSLGVNSTPTFFINGKKFSGVLLPADFKARIEEELKDK